MKESGKTGPAPATTREILRDILAQKMSRNPAFSLRAFARDLGVSHTYLSLVLNGRKPLSMRKVIEFSHRLRLDEKDRRALLAAATRELRARAASRGRSRKAAATDRERFDYFELESDRFRLLEEWYHFPILDLTLTEGFRSDPRWIARRLGISRPQVEDAIDRLKRLGLLEVRAGKLIKTRENMVIHPKGRESQDKLLRKHHQEMISRALRELESGRPEDVSARDITGVIIPADPSRLPEAKRRITAFRRSLWRFLNGGRSTELYQFNLQLIPLTRLRGKKASLLKTGAK